MVRAIGKLVTVSLALMLHAGVKSAGTSPTAPDQMSGAKIYQQARLGESLFFDRRLSAHNDVACASCHQPQQAFSDPRARSVGTDGLLGKRNAPSLLDVARQRYLFWDGRQTSLADQALEPLLNPVEHGLKEAMDVVRIVRLDPGYVHAFQTVFNVDARSIEVHHVGNALAAYELTLESGATPFDRYLAGHPDAISAEAEAGWRLFSGAAGCIECHPADIGRPLFTDHGFHALGANGAGASDKLVRLALAVVALRTQGGSVATALAINPDAAILGRFVVTLDPVDLGKFKTPPLRNVAMTAPYMHDGSVPTLEAAVDVELYYRARRSGIVLQASPGERRALVAFLRSLTSDSYLMESGHGRPPVTRD